MLTIEEKIEIIQNQCVKHDITAYEIGENTTISTSSAHKILTEKNKSPKNKTLNIILEYIQKKVVGTNIGSSVLKEPTAVYETNPEFKSLSIEEKLNRLHEMMSNIAGGIGKLLIDDEEIMEKIKHMKKTKDQL